MAIEVSLDHVGVATVPFGVRGRAAEHFGEERGHVARMVSPHVCENQREQGVVLDVLVEPRGQTVQRIDATEIRRRLMVLEEILGAIEGNVTADLALFSGLARASDPEFEEGTWPAHATARWNY